MQYDYAQTLAVRLTVDKSSNALHAAEMHLDVVQEYSAGARAERITLGHVRLNLAEYVEQSGAGDAADDAVCRRYLMQDSKINSTLKVASPTPVTPTQVNADKPHQISIHMRLIEGERNFIAHVPPFPSLCS